MPISKEILDKVEYDGESPSGLVWANGETKRGRREVGFIHTRKIDGRQRWGTMINYRSLLCHRVIWEKLNGPIPKGMQIDHIDQNPLNNSIENLRLVKPSGNARNKKRYSNKTRDLPSGVNFFKNQSGNTYYSGSVNSSSGGGRMMKYFSVTKLGEELAILCAEEWRDKMIFLLNNNGFGYTDQHGV